MKRNMLLITSAVCAAGLIAIVVGSHAVSAQNEPGKKDKDKPPPVYNPYPFGILPPDLNSEIARVRREVNFIEGEALTESRALPPLTYSNTQGVGNPPILQGTGYQAVEVLGKLLNL